MKRYVGAVFRKEPVADYDEPFVLTCKRVQAAGIYDRVVKLWNGWRRDPKYNPAVFRKTDPRYAELRDRFFRQHAPPPELLADGTAAVDDPPDVPRGPGRPPKPKPTATYVPSPNDEWSVAANQINPDNSCSIAETDQTIAPRDALQRILDDAWWAYENAMHVKCGRKLIRDHVRTGAAFLHINSALADPKNFLISVIDRAAKALELDRRELERIEKERIESLAKIEAERTARRNERFNGDVQIFGILDELVAAEQSGGSRILQPDRQREPTGPQGTAPEPDPTPQPAETMR